MLAVIGVNARGEKHFLAIEDGVRESAQSRREVLPGMKQRNVTRPAPLRRPPGVAENASMHEPGFFAGCLISRWRTWRRPLP